MKYSLSKLHEDQAPFSTLLHSFAECASSQEVSIAFQFAGKSKTAFMRCLRMAHITAPDGVALFQRQRAESSEMTNIGMAVLKINPE